MQDISDNFDELARLNLSTKITDEDWKDAIMDEYGVMYSKNGGKSLHLRRLAPLFSAYFAENKTNNLRKTC